MFGRPKVQLFLDTETTGFHFPRDQIVEIALVNRDGETVLNTLINPGRTIGDAKRFHGIEDAMVQNAPTLREIAPLVSAICADAEVVIYNAEYDAKFLPGMLDDARSVRCCMQRFAPVYGDWNDFHQSYRWKKLHEAMDFIDGEWRGNPHRALADAHACRTVWQWLEDRERFHDHYQLAPSVNDDLLDSEVPF